MEQADHGHARRTAVMVSRRRSVMAVLVSRWRARMEVDVGVVAVGSGLMYV